MPCKFWNPARNVASGAEGASAIADPPRQKHHLGQGLPDVIIAPICALTEAQAQALAALIWGAMP